MHRVLLSRVCRGRCLISLVGSEASLQIWDGTSRLLCFSSRSCAHLYILKKDSSTYKGPFHLSQDPCNYSKESAPITSSQTPKTNMDFRLRLMNEGNGKRPREFVSPPRPTGTKRNVKAAQTSSFEPPLICLDDIPLPKIASTSKKTTPPALDFIPLPPSPPSPPPPPLPPPLPSPPPPPSHSEMEEVIEDFFVIDKTASTPLFPLPMPPRFITGNDRSGNAHNTASSGTAAPVSYSNDSDSDDISVVYNSDPSLHSQFKNINLFDKSKNRPITDNRTTMNSDQIDIVFEGMRSGIFQSPVSRERNQIHRRKRTSPSHQQYRNCHHSTKHSMKTVDKSSESEMVPHLESPQPDIITLDESTNSMVDRMTPEDFISLDTSQNAVFEKETKTPEDFISLDTSQNAVFEKETKTPEDFISLDTSQNAVFEKETKTPEDFISLDTSQNAVFERETEDITGSGSSKKRVKKSKKSKKRKSQKGNLEIVPECSTAVSDREASPGIQKVGVIDPDVVDIENNFSTIGHHVGDRDEVDTSQNADFERETEDNTDPGSSVKKAKTPRKSKKRKSQKDKSKSVLECSTSVSDQEAGPDIQKVGVIDPDVVEIENNFPSTSHYVEDNVEVEDMEIVDVYDSDSENLSKTNSVCDDNLEVADFCESDNESATSDRPGIDISNSEFLSLGKVRPETLENTEIDLDDAVLKKRSRLERLRQWHLTRLGEDVLVNHNARKNDVVFSLMSYNVLAQELLTDNKYLYSSCNQGHTDWKYRWALLQYEITDLNPDVLLLQEVQASHYYSHFLPWLTYKGYDGLYKKRTGEKCDGCAIFYKKSKFSLAESCSVEYLQPRAMHVLDRDNIGLIAKLASVANPKACVCVATTHFLYNPRRHDVKLAQAILLLTELDRICYKGEKHGIVEYCPVIVSGDFNAEPHSALLDMFKEGRLQYEGLSSRSLTQHGSSPFLGAELISPSLGITERCQHAVLAQSRFVEKSTGQLFSLSDKRKIEESLIRVDNTDRNHKRLKGVKGGGHNAPSSGWYSHSFHFNSVYHHFSKKAAEATTFHNKWTTVDYILYSRMYAHNYGQPVEGSLKLLARYGLLTGPDASKFAPLPSAVCPSDHFPLAAQFLLRQIT